MAFPSISAYAFIGSSETAITLRGLSVSVVIVGNWSGERGGWGGLRPRPRQDSGADIQLGKEPRICEIEGSYRKSPKVASLPARRHTRNRSLSSKTQCT